MAVAPYPFFRAGCDIGWHPWRACCPVSRASPVPGRAPRGRPRGGGLRVRCCACGQSLRSAGKVSMRSWLIRVLRLIGCTMIPLINRQARINHNKSITAPSARARTAPLGLPGLVRLQASPSEAASAAEMTHSGHAASITSRRGPAGRPGDLSEMALSGRTPSLGWQPRLMATHGANAVHVVSQREARWPCQ